MRKAWIVFSVLATTLAGRAVLAQEQAQMQEQAQVQLQLPAQPQVAAQTQAQKGPTLGGHIGVLFPLVTHSGGQTINNLADQLAVGFPVGITVKGSARTAFDLDFVLQYNSTGPRLTTLTI